MLIIAYYSLSETSKYISNLIGWEGDNISRIVLYDFHSNGSVSLNAVSIIFWKTVQLKKNKMLVNWNIYTNATKPLIHFMPLVSFYTPKKHQKTRGCMMFSGDTERDQWHEMG